MFDFNDTKSTMISIFAIFLIICVILSIGIEGVKYYVTSQSSGYLFHTTRSTFEPETYEQTNPHLMVSSRNEDMGQEFSYSFWLLIQKDSAKDSGDDS